MNSRVFSALMVLSVLAAPLRADILKPELDLKNLELPRHAEEIDQALKSFQQGDYEQCLKQLQTAGKKHPDLFPPLVILAKLFFVHDQLGLGRATLEQAVVEHPDHPENYLLFGLLALKEGRVTDAALHFDKAVLLAGADKWEGKLKQHFQQEALAGLASVAERRKDWKAVEAVLSAWLKLDPKQGKAREHLGMALFRLGHTKKALEELEEAYKNDPKLDPAGISLGRLYDEAGDLKKAEEWMVYAVGQGPQACLGYARWLLEQNRPEEAKKQAEAAAKHQPDSIEVKIVSGLIAGDLKEYAEAERIFAALHKESPGNFAIGNQLALALIQQPEESKRRRAQELAESHARRYPSSAEALGTLGLVYYRQGNLAEAEKALRAALATGAASADTAYHLARLTADRGQQDLIRPLLKRALQARGHFTFRKEAQQWSDQLDKKP